MKKDCGHTIWPRCFVRVELLQSFQDLLFCESFGELNVHIFCDTPRDCTYDFIDPGGGRGGINFLEIRNSSISYTLLTITPQPIIIPKPQNGILFPPFRSTGMEKLVFLSPSLYQWILLHCRQMVSSLSKRSFISPRSWLISAPLTLSWLALVMALRVLLFSTIFFGILPLHSGSNLPRHLHIVRDLRQPLQEWWRKCPIAMQLQLHRDNPPFLST